MVSQVRLYCKEGGYWSVRCGFYCKEGGYWSVKNDFTVRREAIGQSGKALL